MRSGDTCDSIATTSNITTTQFLTYNPWIDAGCWNFNRTSPPGSLVCVGQPGTQYEAPTGTVGSPSVAASAVPVPTNVAANTTTDCGLYYEVQPGDYCELIVLKYSISLVDFLILNPEVNEK